MRGFDMGFHTGNSDYYINSLGGDYAAADRGTSLMAREEPPACAYDPDAEHDMREVDHMMDGNNPDAVHECRECHACGETGCGR